MSGSDSSFEQGEGRWLGSAEVYDERGEYAGEGHDARVVRRDLDDGSVEVEVSFTGPFRLSGRYVIADHGDHRRYLGPLNYGYAEAFGDRLVDANNYWPDIGLSQRFFMMVLPGGGTQLSLALLSRGEHPAYAVVGEYERTSAGAGGGAEGADPRSDTDRSSGSDPTGDAARSGADRSWGDGPSGADGEAEGAGGRGGEQAGPILERPGTWSGTLALVGPGGDDLGTTDYAERVAASGGDRPLEVSLAGTGFAAGAAVAFSGDGRRRWTGGGAVVGSESLWGGRALSGNLLFGDDGLRLWRREVARRDGTCKGVLHCWYRGGSRVGVAHGVLEFAPAEP